MVGKESGMEQRFDAGDGLMGKEFSFAVGGGGIQLSVGGDADKIKE